MLLKLQRYNIILRYKPGKELYTADTLSRAYLPNTDKEDEELVLCVHQAIARLPVSDKKLTRLRLETANNSAMTKLAETIQGGLPQHKQSCHKDVREYWPVRDELCVTDGLIFRGESILIPHTSYQTQTESVSDDDVLTSGHNSNPG